MIKRVKITVPAADTLVEIKQGGCGVLVEKMALYSNVEDVPSLIFDNPTELLQPLHAYSQYSKENGFERFFIYGTAASAGSTLYLFVSDMFVEQQIKSSFAQEFSTTLDGIQADLSNATDGLGALKTAIEVAQPPSFLQNALIATLASQISFTLDAGSSNNDAYKGGLIVVTDAATSTQKAVGRISAYTGATKTVTLQEDPAIFTMAVGDSVEIFATDKQFLDYTAARAGYIDELAAANLPTDVANVKTVTDGIQTDLSNATDGLGALKLLINANQSDLNTILADTETLSQKAVKSITLSIAAVPVTETLFVVTGEVEMYVVGYIDVAVTSADALTLEVGIAGSTAGLIEQTAVGSLAVDLLWINATPSILILKPSEKIIANGADIIHTIAGASATAGAITYTCYWRPISSDGNVVAA